MVTDLTEIKKILERESPQKVETEINKFADIVRSITESKGSEMFKVFGDAYFGKLDSADVETCCQIGLELISAAGRIDLSGVGASVGIAYGDVLVYSSDITGALILLAHSLALAGAAGSINL
jgi:class 3 adenylate cyclase